METKIYASQALHLYYYSLLAQNGLRFVTTIDQIYCAKRNTIEITPCPKKRARSHHFPCTTPFPRLEVLKKENISKKLSDRKKDR